MERVYDVRAQADEVVVKSLYTKATIDKDTTAMIFWLKNRRPKEWRDRKELEMAIPDIQGTLREAAERARERKRVMLEAIRHDAITAKVVGRESSALVPFVPFVPGGKRRKRPRVSA